MKDSLKLHKQIVQIKKIFIHLLVMRMQMVLLFLLPVLLAYILALLLVITEKIDGQVQQVSLKEDPADQFRAAPYPILQTQSAVLGVQQNSPLLSAGSAIVVDNDSQVTLFSKNSHDVFSMASTTKIMTALVDLDYFQMDDILTIYDSRESGAVVGVKEGQRFYFKDLLYAMLLPSGNDIARAIAQNYPGGESAFVGAMNNKAEHLHLFNTRFTDPTGLDGNNISTAKDLATLASYAVKNPVFTDIVATKNISISDVSGRQKYTLANLNRLLGANGVNGIKTGFTEEAGEVLVTSQSIDGHTLIIVVMKSSNRFLDTQSLLSGVSEKVKYLLPDASISGN